MVIRDSSLTKYILEAYLSKVIRLKVCAAVTSWLLGFAKGLLMIPTERCFWHNHTKHACSFNHRINTPNRFLAVFLFSLDLLCFYSNQVGFADLQFVVFFFLPKTIRDMINILKILSVIKPKRIHNILILETWLVFFPLFKHIIQFLTHTIIVFCQDRVIAVIKSNQYSLNKLYMVCVNKQDGTKRNGTMHATNKVIVAHSSMNSPAKDFRARLLSLKLLICKFLRLEIHRSKSTTFLKGVIVT